MEDRLKIGQILKNIKRDELIKLTQELIKIPSVRRQDRGSEEKVALFVARHLE